MHTQQTNKQTDRRTSHRNCTSLIGLPIFPVGRPLTPLPQQYRACYTSARNDSKIAQEWVCLASKAKAIMLSLQLPYRKNQIERTGRAVPPSWFAGRKQAGGRTARWPRCPTPHLANPSLPLSRKGRRRQTCPPACRKGTRAACSLRSARGSGSAARRGE